MRSKAEKQNTEEKYEEMMNLDKTVLESLKKSRSARFAALEYTSKGTGERSQYQLLVNVDLRKLYENDVETLKKLIQNLSANSIEYQAANELLASLEESLKAGIGQNSAYKLKDWMSLDSKSNLKISKDKKNVIIRGVLITKRVIEKKEKREVKSSPKTLAKKNLRLQLKSSAIRNFSLNVENIKRLALNGDVIETIKQ